MEGVTTRIIDEKDWFRIVAILIANHFRENPFQRLKLLIYHGFSNFHGTDFRLVSILGDARF
jgi:hypothetical protein